MGHRDPATICYRQHGRCLIPMADRPPHPTDARGAPAFPQTATPPSKPATGTETVTVACKYPPGLILRIHEETKKRERVLGVMVEETVFVPRSQQYVVRGPVVNVGAYRNAGQLPEGNIGGYALTHGIPRDFWEQWLRENEHSAMVVNRLIFASTDMDRAASQAREQASIRSGLEPIPPDDPASINPREFAGITRGTHAPGARAAT